ncbi:unnamed protein product, partial [Oikopleura dioica]
CSQGGFSTARILKNNWAPSAKRKKGFAKFEGQSDSDSLFLSRPKKKRHGSRPPTVNRKALHQPFCS